MIRLSNLTDGWVSLFDENFLYC